MSNRKTPIYVLGPQGTNGHQVALHVQGELLRSEIVFVNSHREIFERVTENEGWSYGIVPIENSSGLVGDVIGYWRHAVKPVVQVVREFTLPVRHHLLVRESMDPADVKKVYSRKEALIQCKESIESHKLDAVEVLSTAEGARLVSESDENIAALGSEFLACCWGLTIGISNMHDYEANATRFHVICKYETANNGEGRTAIMFRVNNHVGSLVDILLLFKERGINIASIISLPFRTETETEFYCEVDAYVLDFPPIEKLQRLTKNFRMLGSYDRQVLV